MLHKVPAIAKGEGQRGHAHHRGLQGCRKGVSQNRDQQTQYTKDFFIKTALRRGHMMSHVCRNGIVSKNSPNLERAPVGLPRLDSLTASRGFCTSFVGAACIYHVVYLYVCFELCQAILKTSLYWVIRANQSL